jgi:transposase InsO family protein
MRYTQSEKLEIIRLVDESKLPARRTLLELDIAPSTFHQWYVRYQERGEDGLASYSPTTKQFWNRIPQEQRRHIRDVALQNPAMSARALAWHITDTEEWYVSESSVYRILRAFDLLPAPAHIVHSAGKEFKHPTHDVNELWQTDFTYFKVTAWGWYFLGTILDDYSRFIIAWKLTTTMNAEDVTVLLTDAMHTTGVDRPRVKHKPRLLSDNGPCYVSGELAQWMEKQGMKHTRGAPYHPQTQGKIERYHRSMKNCICLENHYFPGDLEEKIRAFVDYYNYERVHESIGNVTPADVFFGKRQEILDRREIIKRKTMNNRRIQHRASMAQEINNSTRQTVS